MRLRATCECAQVQAIGAPISRLALYTAYGGLQPARGLPVTIDVGTDNESLLQARPMLPLSICSAVGDHGCRQPLAFGRAASAMLR